MRFPKITTFDSSKTPDGADAASIVLAPIDLGAIEGRLASLKQEKVANDPLALRKRIAELEAQLRAKPSATTASPNTKALAAANAEAYRNGFDAGVEAYSMNFEAIRATLASEAFQLISTVKLNKPKPTKASAKIESAVVHRTIPATLPQAKHVNRPRCPVSRTGCGRSGLFAVERKLPKPAGRYANRRDDRLSGAGIGARDRQS